MENAPQDIAAYREDAFITRTTSIITMGNMETERGVTHIHKPFSAKPPNPDRMTFHPLLYMAEHVTCYKDLSTFPQLDDQKRVVKPGVPEFYQALEFSDGRPTDFKCMPYWCDLFFHPIWLLGEKTLGGLPLPYCPTMQLEIQFKRIPKGKQVLAWCVVPHLINGRMDLDGAIFEKDGQLLAITRHQCLVVPWSRVTKPTKAKL